MNSRSAEAALVVATPAEECLREPAEDRPTTRVLRRETPQPAVHDERGVVRTEPTAIGFRGDEKLGRHVHRLKRTLGENAAVVKYAF